MEKIGKIFCKIFMITVIIYIIGLGFGITFLNHTVTPNETYVGISMLILFCTELILEEVKNKNK